MSAFQSKHIVLLASLLASIAPVAASAAPTTAPIKNIVLVHGAWVDASGWRPVYDILTRDGFHVTMVQQPLTSLADDVAATKRILDQQDGPTVLVAHSHVTVLEGASHSVYESRPKEVAAVIEAAARSVETVAAK